MMSIGGVSIEPKNSVFQLFSSSFLKYDLPHDPPRRIDELQESIENGRIQIKSLQKNSSMQFRVDAGV